MQRASLLPYNVPSTLVTSLTLSNCESSHDTTTLPDYCSSFEFKIFCIHNRTRHHNSIRTEQHPSTLKRRCQPKKTRKSKVAAHSLFSVSALMFLINNFVLPVFGRIYCLLIGSTALLNSNCIAAANSATAWRAIETTAFKTLGPYKTVSKLFGSSHKLQVWIISCFSLSACISAQ